MEQREGLRICMRREMRCSYEGRVCINRGWRQVDVTGKSVKEDARLGSHGYTAED
jgi:hypothetical protein